MKNLAGLCSRFLEDLWISGMIGVFLLFMVEPLNHIWVYADEGPHAGPLGSFRVGAFQAWKTNHVIRGLALSQVTSTQLRRREGGLKIELSGGQWFSQSCLCNETLIKTLDIEASLSFPAW